MVSLSFSPHVLPQSAASMPFASGRINALGYNQSELSLSPSENQSQPFKTLVRGNNSIIVHIFISVQIIHCEGEGGNSRCMLF